MTDELVQERKITPSHAEWRTEHGVPAGWKPSMKQPVPTVQCVVIKKDGNRCARWAIRGGTECVNHGGRLPNAREHAAAVVEAARMRLINSSDQAIDTLLALTEVGTADQIRLKASTEVLDRAGIRGGFELDVDIEVQVNPADTVAERLEQLKSRAAAAAVANYTSQVDPHDVIEGEIVEFEQDTLF